MDWFSILFSFITIGVLVDLFAFVCIIRYQFGLSFNKKGKTSPYSARGIPAGPIFYFLGLLQLIFINKKPLSLVLIVFTCCVLFYALVIFSALIVSNGVKLIRRAKARNRKVFYNNPANGIAPRTAVEQSLKYLVDDCPENPSGDIGFVYLKTDRAFKKAIIRMLASRESLISAEESDPGHIILGRFAADMAEYGFSINQWQVDKRNRIVVPFNDYNQIPLFIDALFSKYYNCGDSYQIKAEVLKMS